MSNSAKLLINFFRTTLGATLDVKSRYFASFWLIQACTWNLNLSTGGPRDMSYEERRRCLGSLNKEELMQWSKVGHPPLVKEDNCDYHIVYFKEHTEEPEREFKRWKICMWEEVVQDDRRTAEQLYIELQVKLKELRYLLQRLHLQVRKPNAPRTLLTTRCAAS